MKLKIFKFGSFRIYMLNLYTTNNQQIICDHLVFIKRNLLIYLIIYQYFFELLFLII
jgi:hypothetical protein